MSVTMYLQLAIDNWCHKKAGSFSIDILVVVFGTIKFHFTYIDGVVVWEQSLVKSISYDKDHFLALPLMFMCLKTA